MQKEYTLFEIPAFRRNAKFLKELFEESNSLTVGSKEWIEEMSKTFLLKDFTNLEVPTNLEDFIAIKNFSDFIEDENPTQLYIFAYLFKEDVVEYLIHILVDSINDDNIDFFTMDDEERQKYKDHLPKYDFINDIDYDKYIIENKERVLISAKEMIKLNLPYKKKLIKFIKKLENTFFYTIGCSINCEEGDFNIELQFKSGGIISTVYFGIYEDWKYFFSLIEGDEEEFEIEETKTNDEIKFYDDVLTFCFNDSDNFKSSTLRIIFTDLNRKYILKQLDAINEECKNIRKYDKSCLKMRMRGERNIPPYEKRIANLLA